MDPRRFNKFILCLNILFAINVYLTLIYGVLGLRVPGHSLIVYYGPSVLFAVMIGLGAQELWHARYYSEIVKRRDVAFAINAYFSICLLMVLQIPLNLAAYGESKSLLDRSLPLLNGVLTWLLPVVAVFGLKVENWNTIRRTVCWQSAIGCSCLLFAIPATMLDIRQSNPLEQRLNLQELTGGVLFNGNPLLYAGTFLLMSFRSLSLFWRLIAVMTAGLTMWIAMVGQFRSGVTVVLMAAALGLLYVPLRVRATSVENMRSKVVAPLLFVLCVLFTIGFSSLLSNKLSAPYAAVSEYVEAITKRGVSISDEGFVDSIDIRIQESLEALSEQNLVQLIVGKGFGATWSGGTLYEERRGMLHLGIGHLLLHGGILLALFTLLGPALMSIRVFLKSHSQTPLACAGVLCVGLSGTFISNIFDPNVYYLMYSLCLGGILLHLQEKDARLRVRA
jgi:hypothetical protein